MKFLIAFALTAVLGFAALLYLPWYSLAITSAIVALTVHQKPFKAFGAGFAGMFILWGVQAFFIDMQNNHLLSQKIAQVLMLGNSWALITLITALAGGLVSGFAALTGSYARRLK